VEQLGHPSFDFLIEHLGALTTTLTLLTNFNRKRLKMLAEFVGTSMTQQKKVS